MFTSRHLKHAKHLARSASEVLHRQSDLLKPEDVAKYETSIAEYRKTIARGDRAEIEKAGAELDQFFGPIAPPKNELRDWTETIVVSIAVVVAFRAYFLQPFAIPTGSMQPTLNGLIVHKIAASESIPSAPQRWAEKLLFGYSYVDFTAPRNDRIVALREANTMGFFARTTLEWESGERTTLGAPARQVMDTRDGFGAYAGRVYKAGEVVARGYVQAGDQVFVDRFTYHFRRPQRGEVFVFKTEGIAGIGGGQAELSNPNRGEHYIKRLGGVPGDELRIKSPQLFVNGAVASEFGLDRVMKSQPPYAGYGNIQFARFLKTPLEKFKCEEKDYFALGDNSYNSSDSRFWGPVPEPNLLGPGFMVYWPLGKHWGFIK